MNVLRCHVDVWILSGTREKGLQLTFFQGHLTTKPTRSPLLDIPRPSEREPGWGEPWPTLLERHLPSRLALLVAAHRLADQGRLLQVGRSWFRAFNDLVNTQPGRPWQWSGVRELTLHSASVPASPSTSEPARWTRSVTQVSLTHLLLQVVQAASHPLVQASSAPAPPPTLMPPSHLCPGGRNKVYYKKIFIRPLSQHVLRPNRVAREGVPPHQLCTSPLPPSPSACFYAGPAISMSRTMVRGQLAVT